MFKIPEIKAMFLKQSFENTMDRSNTASIVVAAVLLSSQNWAWLLHHHYIPTKSDVISPIFILLRIPWYTAVVKRNHRNFYITRTPICKPFLRQKSKLIFVKELRKKMCTSNQKHLEGFGPRPQTIINPS